MTNPAGLAWLEHPLSVCLSSSLLPLGQSLHYLGIAGWPRAKTAVGFGALIYSPGSDIEVRTSNTLAPVRVISPLSQAYALGAAWRFFPPLNFGASLRLLFDSIGAESAVGFSADLGLQYRPYDRIFLALMAQNAAGSSLCALNWSSGHSEPLPAVLRAGLALDLNPLLVVAEARDIKSRYTRLSLGLEAEFLPVFRLRAGINEGDLAAGFGTCIPLHSKFLLRLDYSFAKASLGWSDYEHRLSLALDLLQPGWRCGELAFPTERPAPKPVVRQRRAPPLFKWPL